MAIIELTTASNESAEICKEGRLSTLFLGVSTCVFSELGVHAEKQNSKTKTDAIRNRFNVLKRINNSVLCIIYVILKTQIYSAPTAIGVSGKIE